MSMRFFFALLCACAIASLLMSCEHRPLDEPKNARYIRVYIDEDIKNVTCGIYNEAYERPEYVRPRAMRVVAADPNTGKVVSERYIQEQGTDEHGYYMHGYISLPPGTYNMLVYSYGSAYTLISNPYSYYAMAAYTSPVSEYYNQYMPSISQTKGPEGIRQQPDHIFHEVVEGVTTQVSPTVDTLRHADGSYYKAHSMVKSYYIQLKVKGIEWATSAISVLSGMAGSSLMHSHEGMVETDNTNVLFSMKQASRYRSTDDGSSSAVLYTTFHTFGKLPDHQNMLAVSFEFMKRDGTSQVEEIDITDMFSTPMVRDNQWILIEKEIELLPPADGSSGGMTPGVDDWDDIESGIIL